MNNLHTVDAPVERQRTPADIDIGLQNWRRNLAAGQLRALRIVGALAVLAGSYFAYARNDLWVIPIYVISYALLVGVTFWRRAPYILQAGLLLILMYTLGIVDILEVGKGGDGRIFLLTLPILAGLLLGRRGAIITLSLTVVTLAGFGIVFSRGILSVPVEKQATSADLSAWMSNIAIILMLGTTMIVSQDYLTRQLSATATRSRAMAHRLEEHQGTLEQEINDRTKVLQEANTAIQRRAMLLEASADVGSVITSIFDVDHLLAQVVNSIQERFNFYHTGIYLLDESGRWLVLREATGDAGARMKATGYRLPLSESTMIGATALRRETRVAHYTHQDMRVFAKTRLPYTRSQMVLPLLLGEDILGVLDIRSIEEDVFDADDVRAVRSMASQIAIALQNARQFSEEATMLESTSPLFRINRRLAQAATTDSVASAVVNSIAETGVDGCSVVEFGEWLGGVPVQFTYRANWRRAQHTIGEMNTWLPIEHDPLPPDISDTLWTIRDVLAEESSVEYTEAQRLPYPIRELLATQGIRAVANIPLQSHDRVLGHIIVLRNSPGPFPSGALRLYEALSTQAAVAFERARLWDDVQEHAAREKIIREAAIRMRETLDIDTVLQTGASEISTALGLSALDIRLRLADDTAHIGGPSS